MTAVQVLAFVVVPIVVMAGGWALARWAERSDDRARAATRERAPAE